MNYRNQQFDKARKYYESILQKENSPLASFGLGTSAFQLGDIESAVKAFDDALKSEDDRLKAKSYYNMETFFIVNREWTKVWHFSRNLWNLIRQIMKRKQIMKC